jgi:quinoprotein glucose dehydrogenase
MDSKESTPGKGSRWALALVATLGLVACLSTDEDARVADDWALYRGDLAGTGYSPLGDITPANVTSLDRAWSYDLGPAEPPPGGSTRGPNSQATPIVIDGVMYLPAADRVVALDPTTGAEIWQHLVDGGALSRRGVAYWEGEGAMSPRILFMAGPRLIALDAATGSAAEGFGFGGEVDIGVPYNSVPLVYDHIVVVGANTPPGAPGGIGNARAFDARDGSPIWEFSSVPQPGQVGHDTWEGDSWDGRLGVNAWPFYFTLDEERELLYLPLAAPIPFWYGGDRPGANLFGNSVVAVDVRSRPAGATRALRRGSSGRHRASPRRDHQVGLPVHPQSRDG